MPFPLFFRIAKRVPRTLAKTLAIDSENLEEAGLPMPGAVDWVNLAAAAFPARTAHYFHRHLNLIRRSAFPTQLVGLRSQMRHVVEMTRKKIWA